MGAVASSPGSLEGWEASLDLGFERRRDRTVLARRRQRGPLAVQRTFYPEGETCHLYVLHPPGGVAGGDRLGISIEGGPRTSALVTTPGATKFYNSIGPRAVQTQKFTLAGGCLEWLPQENIYFPNAAVDLETEIDLHDDAVYIGWEIHCLGRPASGERFGAGRLALSTALRRDGNPLLLDRLVVDSDALTGKATCRDRPVVATLIATGAGTAGALARARELLDSGSTRTGVTLMDDLLVCRYLGGSTEEARRLFIAVWSVIRPEIIGKQAVPPRIWAT